MTPSTSTTTIRIPARERMKLDRLADDMLCSRSSVVRHGIAALRQNNALREQVRADNLARAFLSSLRSTYGPNATIELKDGPRNPQWRLAGEPLDQEVVSASVQRQGDRWVMRLVDPKGGVGINNVTSWTDDEADHVVVRLRDLWVYSEFASIGDPSTRQTPDGRTIVSILEDDGTTRELVLDNEGNSAPMDPRRDAPTADRLMPDPSVGVGVRRESAFGPHLGQGVGGQFKLRGDIKADRAEVVRLLHQLIDATEAGELDGVLDPQATHEGAMAAFPVRGAATN